MQAPGDPDEDRSGGFDAGGWQLAYFDELFAGFVMEGFAATGLASASGSSATRRP